MLRPTDEAQELPHLEPRVVSLWLSLHIPGSKKGKELVRSPDTGSMRRKLRLFRLK